MMKVYVLFVVDSFDADNHKDFVGVFSSHTLAEQEFKFSYNPKRYSWFVREVTVV